MKEQVVYRQNPCRRCGVSIVHRDGSLLGRCACQKRRKPIPPTPGPVFTAYSTR